MPTAIEIGMGLQRTGSVPVIRPCPLCGVAMQGKKSRQDLKTFDTFLCLSCDTTVVEAASATNPNKAPQN